MNSLPSQNPSDFIKSDRNDQHDANYFKMEELSSRSLTFFNKNAKGLPITTDFNKGRDVPSLNQSSATNTSAVFKKLFQL